MPYSHFRFIAYEVPTATSLLVGGPVVSGFPPGRRCAAVPRIPVDPTTPIDAQIRLMRLAAVVDRALTFVKTQIDDSPAILKIFMAPEFYFRPPKTSTLGVPYPFNTYPRDEAYAILTQLDQMFTAADLEDWLIVPGTVMWHEAQPGRTSDRLIRNTAAWIRGGVANSLHVIEKFVPSGIDGVPSPMAPQLGPYDPFLMRAVEQWSYRKQHVFDIDNVSCGLEVCLDHADHDLFRVLKRTLSDWRREEATLQVKEISLHLLTAGGMPIKPRSLAARPFGYILRNDGYANHPRSQVKRVETYTKEVPEGWLGQLSTVNTYSDDLAGSAKFSGNVYDPVTDIPLLGNEFVPKMGDGYMEFTQRLSVFERLPLP